MTDPQVDQVLRDSGTAYCLRAESPNRVQPHSRSAVNVALERLDDRYSLRTGDEARWNSDV